MSAETSKLVPDILDAVRDGLAPFVLKHYQMHYSSKDYLARLQENLSIDALEDEAQSLDDFDLPDWLNAIEAEWDGIFSKRIGHRARGSGQSPDSINARSFLFELRNARNRWAHRRRDNAFSNDDIYRLADTATRLLHILKASPEAERTAEIRTELGRSIHGVGMETESVSTHAGNVELTAIEDRRRRAVPTKSAPTISFQEQATPLDLSGKDLREWSLKSGNLQSANLSRVNLAGVDLALADLKTATLVGSNLTRANLTSTTLSGANLSGAILREARVGITLQEQLDEDDWRELAEIHLWQLEGIPVHHRSLAEESWLNISQYVERFALTDFRGANLEGADMRDVYFCNDIYGFYVDVVNILGLVSFRNANLSFANLTGATLALADFGEANLADARLTGADICLTNFSDANMTRANLSNIVDQPWGDVDADFSRADLTQAVMDNAWLIACIFNDAKLTRASCANSEFSSSEFRGADLSHSVLKSAVLENARMEKAHLKGADLSNAKLARATALDADFNEAKLVGAHLKEAQLSRANLTRADLTEADLTSANLSNAVLRNAELKEANFTKADLTGADLTGANLMDANFESAILKDANLEKAKFRFTTKLPDGSYWSDDTDLTRFTDGTFGSAG